MLHFQIMHVAMLLVVAFFIFFAAQKADGFVSLFGNILGALILLGAVFHIVAMFVPGLGPKMGMHDGMMRGHWMMHHEDAAGGNGTPAMAPANPAPAAAPAQPAPAPKKP